MPPFLPQLLGVMLLVASSIGLMIAYRLRRAKRPDKPMTPAQVEQLQATVHANAIQMVHDLNKQLEPQGKRISERIILDILDIDLHELSHEEEQEEGQDDA